MGIITQNISMNVPFLLECNCFTVVCEFLLFSEVSQRYVYTHPLPAGPPSYPTTHPSRSSASIRLSTALRSTFALSEITVLHMAVYLCQTLPPDSSHPLLPLLCPHVRSLLASLFLPWNSVHLYHCSWLYIRALTFDTSFSLSDLLHSVWQTLGPCTSLQISQFQSFL